ncbi:MAG: hypothetical protein WAM82_35590 [Thermoanaerobaculia bacterium]
MKMTKRRLTLNRETLRRLEARELTAAGGATKTCGSTSCPQQCGPTEVASCTSCVCSAMDPCL